LHASAFDGDSGELIPGIDLEFNIMASDKGRKAYAVHFAGAKSVTPEASHAIASPAIASSAIAFSATTTEEDQMCDVLSGAEFGAELTELLLNTAQGLTGPQIVEVRHGMLEFARKRGWVYV
jgi:hypothetical protein